jgi:hypothetical protein
MKSLKSSCKIFLGPMIGFALGAMFFHSPSVRAQGPRTVHVIGVETSVTISGEVVGFSCVPTDPVERKMIPASAG